MRASAAARVEHIAVIGRTHTDVREICFEHQKSGLLTVTPPELVADYRKSLGSVRMTLTNGSVIQGYSATEPDALRGPARDLFWCDEMGSYPRQTAQDVIDQAWLTMRESPRPRMVVTTTPKPVPWIKKLLKRAETDPAVVIRRGRTLDNQANLSPAALAELLAAYGGTRLGRQELDGELLEDVEGALWRAELIEACRWTGGPLPELVDTVTAVDPSGSATGDACGIVTVGITRGGLVLVLEDSTSAGAGPEARYEAACLAAVRHGSGLLLYEANYGGDASAGGLRSAWTHLMDTGRIDRDMARPRIRPATAKGDKAARAEPVVGLYEQTAAGTDRIRHAVPLPLLEQEMTTWVPGSGAASPNRIDAMVWAVRRLTKHLGLVSSVSSPNAAPASSPGLAGGIWG